MRSRYVKDATQAFNCYILPRFRHVSLSAVTVKELSDFRAELIKRGLSVKTCRNGIDGAFRAMFRDARAEIGGALEGKDPFIDLRWPKARREPPDPLTAEEQTRILDAFLEHEPWYYPFVRFQFETGMRPSETTALSWADVDTEARTIRIIKSRVSDQEDNTKTDHSERTITISRALMDIVASLRQPWSGETSKVFLNKFGDPLNQAGFKTDYWDRVLAALNIRKRKFYATRHTLITAMVKRGIGLKDIADYCGTSVTMIEKHYCAKSQLDPDELNGHGEEFEKRTSNYLTSLASPTGFEPVLPA